MVEQKMTTVESILDEVENTPLLSPCAVQLLKVVGDPDHSLNEVVKIVECDPELTAYLLRRVNSASFGLVSEVTSVARAVSYLGERLVVGVALSACSADLFNQELGGYEGGKSSLWEHSLKTAVAARELVVVGKSDASSEVAFTAGLLHDIGKMVISDFMIGKAESILEKIDSNDFSDYLEGEQGFLGIDHCAVGEALGRRWNLPEVLVNAIAHHHHPELAEEKDRALAYAVHLGDILAMMGGSGTGADSLGYSIHPEYSNYMNITEEDIGLVMLNVMTEFKKTMRLVNGEDTQS